MKRAAPNFTVLTASLGDANEADEADEKSTMALSLLDSGDDKDANSSEGLLSSFRSLWAMNSAFSDHPRARYYSFERHKVSPISQFQ